jgi:response regulator RpfG family c-di-GMP phosphodiesterase
MPEMSGVEFFSNIKNDYPDIIRLLLTGYADINAVIDAINEGNIYRYITKPWNYDELSTIVNESFEKYYLILEN